MKLLAPLGVALALVCASPLPAQAQLDKAALDWTIPWDADWVTAVTFAGPGRTLAAGNKLGHILVWELPAKGGGLVPMPARKLDGHANAVTALAATPDGRWLVSASYDRTVRLWDLKQPVKGEAVVVLKGERRKPKAGEKPLEAKVPVQEAAKVLTAHKEWVRSLSLTPDGRHLLTGDDSGTAILWAMPEAKEVRRLEGKGWLQAVALSPDATLAATCIYAPRYAEFKNTIHLWDAAAGKVKLDLGPPFKRGSEGVTGMAAAAFSRDGKVLALGQGGEVENGKVYLLSAADGKKLHELPGHQNGVTCLAFHPDGKHLASGGRDTVVRLWSVANGKQVAQLGKGRGGQFKDWLHAVSFSADGRSVAAADMAGMIHVWTFPPPAGASHDAPDPRRPAVARAGR